LYALALIHFTYKGIMKISSGSVLMGVVFILIALAGAVYWYWQSRPVRWGQQMLTAVVEDCQPELAQKVYAQLSDEEQEVLESHHEWFETQCLKRLPKKDYSPILLVNRAQRYEYCIRHNAPKTVVDEEGRCLAEEMIVYNYCIKETN
jgi:hypothetical protein